jgi:hypothetical protein
MWPHHVIILVFQNMAVVNLGLRRTNAGWEIILRPDCGELSGICVHRVFETALGRIRLHRCPVANGVESIPPGTPSGPP